MSWERHHIEVVRTAAAGNLSRATDLLREHLASVGCDPLALRIVTDLRRRTGNRDGLEDFERPASRLSSCPKRDRAMTVQNVQETFHFRVRVRLGQSPRIRPPGKFRIGDRYLHSVGLDPNSRDRPGEPASGGRACPGTQPSVRTVWFSRGSHRACARH